MRRRIINGKTIKAITSGIIACALAMSGISVPQVKAEANEQTGSGYVFIDEYPTEGDYQDGERIKAIEANKLYNKRAFVDFAKKTSNKYTGLTYTHSSVFDKCTIINGIDVSKWNGTIDWAKVKADGIEFAFIRVGNRGVFDGKLYEDPTYEYNLKEAIAAGVKVGVYVYSQATTQKEAIEEANFALSRIKKYNITMPVVFDFEYYNGPSGRLYDAHLTVKQATAVCEAFCKRVEDAGYTGMLYGNPSMFKWSVDADQVAKKYPIWLAHYTTETSYTGEYDYWQYSSSGKINGISGAVDCIFWYNPVASTGLTLSASKKTMTVGQKYKIKGTLKPKKSTDIITWKSSNPNVAYIDQSGNIVASYRGTTTITGTTTSGISKTCELTVYDKLTNYEIAPLSTSTYTYSGSENKPTISIRSKKKRPKTGVTNTSVNLRTGPGVEYSAKLTLPVNASVKIYNTHKSSLDEDWYSVSYKVNNRNYRGYVFAEYVTPNVDYIVLANNTYKVDYQSNINAGTAKITADAETAKYFKGQLTKEFTINHKSIKELSKCNIDSYNYTGSPIEPDVIMLYKSMVLKKDKDYKLSYSNNIGSGEANIKIEGIGNYKDTVSKTFRIIGSRKYTIEAVDNQIFTGEEIKPQIVLRDSETGKVLDSNEYEVTYSDNRELGTAKATIRGIGKYDGVSNVYFEIVESKEDNRKPISVYNVENSEYTGKEITKAVKVVADGVELSEENYEITYENNVEVGAAKVIVTGKGAYTGKIEIIYYIERANINNSGFSVNEISDKIYSGEPNLPQVILQNETKGLIDGTDYIVEYLDNTDAGNATIKLTGIGNYTGVREIKFNILPKSIEAASVNDIENMTYAMKALNPKPAVKCDQKTLLDNIDYKLSYKNNTKVGVATVYISGCGNYSGTISKTFNIVQRNIRTCTFGEIKNVSYTGKSRTPSVSVKYENNILEKNKSYKVEYFNNKAIGRAKVTIKGIGNFTGEKTLYFKIVPSKVQKTVLKKNKTNVEIKWDNVKGASGYAVYRSTSKTGKYKRIADVKKNAYTNKNLAIGSTYYYKVRAYKVVNGKKYYGEFSTVKSTRMLLSGKAKVSSLNVRKSAGTSSAVILRLNKNEKVTILKKIKDNRNNIWYQVKINKASKTYTGYVFAKYIQY